MASKRQAEDSVDSDNKRKQPLDSRPKCFFGLKCYRRNPEHFKDYSHPHLENLKSSPGEDTSTILKTQWQIVKDLNLLNSASDNENVSNTKDSSEKGKVAPAKPTPIKLTPTKPTLVKVAPTKPTPNKVPPIKPTPVKTPPAKTVEPSKVSFFHQCSKMQIIPLKILTFKLVFSNFFGFSD